jgi:hypothetical protein
MEDNELRIISENQLIEIMEFELEILLVHIEALMQTEIIICIANLELLGLI